MTIALGIWLLANGGLAALLLRRIALAAPAGALVTNEIEARIVGALALIGCALVIAGLYLLRG